MRATRSIPEIALAMAVVSLSMAAAASASAAIVNVLVTNFAFVPAATNIFVNDTVIWTWAPVNSQNHDVFSLSTPQAWTASAILTGPATFTNTFTAAGDYPYICLVHGFTGSIAVEAAPPPAPAVAITNPANGSLLSGPASFVLEAAASEPGGTITNVAFLQGPALLGNVASAPYSVQVTNLPIGDYLFTAIASDTNGLTATNTIAIQVVAGNVIVLGGNLAFGVVAAGASATGTLAIGNGGGTIMTVSNISYPAGFSGPFSGTVGPGSNQAVAVTFSPGAPGFYSGLITVNSDAPNGVNTIPVSGFGATANLVLTILTNGSGRVSPNLNGRTLVKGAQYTLTAIAGTGEIFSNWTGSIITNANPLTFTMAPGTLLQANFAPNPFTALAGVYNGLFMASNGVTATTAGMLRSFVVNTSGRYGGALFLNGRRESAAGKFDAAGRATNALACLGPQVGTVTLTMSLATGSNSPPQIFGTVAGTNFLADLVADREDDAFPSGEFTLLIPPGANSPQKSPGGDGYALLTNHNGAVLMTGALADGAAFSEAASVSRDGYVPLFASLYGGKGLLLGWINLDLTNNSGTGLAWIHPPRRTGLYQAGFTNMVSSNQISVSAWADPPANLNSLTNLVLLGTLSDTNVPGAITSTIAIAASGRIAGPLANGSVNLKTGQFKVVVGRGASALTGFGAILSDQTNGGGHFLTKTNAQAVQLSP